MAAVILKTTSPRTEKLDLLVLLLHGGERAPEWVDKACGGAAARAHRLGDFKGSLRQIALLYGEAKSKAARYLLVGLGPRKTSNAEGLRRAVGRAIDEARRLESKKIGLVLGGNPPRALKGDAFAGAAAEAAVLADYEFSRHKGKDGASKRGKLSVAVFAERSARHAIDRATIVAEATNLARDLANAPGNYGTPSALAAAAQKAGRSAGFKVKVLQKAEMQKLGMGGLLGVARGSNEPPRFIQMDYKPKGSKKTELICLVGKGLTFDSGGISLKPADKMWEMKFDKCGGCAVIGAMMAVARAKLPIRVVGLVPSTENMPGGSANKPGDVLTAMNGKTIEVLNTDAEGRLILADALAYSERFEPDAIVDFATLTGSVVVALGDVRAGLMSTHEDLSQALSRAGEATGERVWPLPMDDAYGEHVKSEVADVKNLGKGREAGSIAGGWFLRNFVPEGAPWAHLDIAGTAWNSSDPKSGYIGAGATGFGVRLAFEFLRARSAR